MPCSDIVNLDPEYALIARKYGEQHSTTVKISENRIRSAYFLGIFPNHVRIDIFIGGSSIRKRVRVAR
jgi:hypothetical protein